METFLTRQLGTIDLSSTAHSRVRRKEFTYGGDDSAMTGNSKPTTHINIPNHSTERRDTLLLGGEVVFEEERTVTNAPTPCKKT